MLLTLKNTRHGSLPGNGCGGFITAIKHPSPGSFIMEIWKDISGFEGFYQVSNLGRVKSLRKSRVLSLPIRGGYYSVSLSVNGKAKQVSVHRLVAEAFHPNPLNKPCVNHKHGNKLDNRAIGLEWTTHSENSKHAIDTGLVTNPVLFGDRNGMSKLTTAKAKNIRALYKCGMLQKDLGDLYGVDPSTISSIICNKTWRALCIK